MEELRIRFSEEERKKAHIKVIGVGGAGGNAINTMIEAQLQGVDFIAINTDYQALELSKAPICLPIGKTHLGAGADPEVGRLAMEEERDRLFELLANTDMVFVTAGLGGGTGTGAAPVVAQVAKELGILVVAVVTKPFIFEGKQRALRAEEGMAALKSQVDTLIIIPNQRLISIIERGTRLRDAFKKADQVLLQATRGISDLIMVPGLINLDFADVKAVMSAGGDALMGIGIASGDNRAVEATRSAISSPFMDDVSVNGARAVLANITGDLSFDDFNEAHSEVFKAVGDDANIFVGAVVDPDMGDEIRVTIIATGFNGVKAQSLALPHTTTEASRSVNYRPPRLVFDRAAVGAALPESTPAPDVSEPAALPKVALDRSAPATFSLDDRNVPTFLRKPGDT